MILKCLEEGYEGILILACPLDNCKYVRGNYRAQKRVDAVKKILDDIGIERESVQIEFVSSLDSHKVAEAINGMKAYLAKRGAKG
jgi:coenzyme F420-reducing hydrogenase delta subunit